MPAKKTPSKGKGLTKKVGPFPVYVYLGVVVVIAGYIYYRRRRGTTTIPGSQNQQVIPIAIPSGGQGGTPVSTGSSDTGTAGSQVTYPYDYVTNTDLQNAIDNLDTNLKQDIANITFPNPQNPNVNITVPPAQVIVQTQKSKTAAHKAAATSAPTRYYTSKKQVQLKAGQTLHFRKGKGYYAG